MIRIEQGNHISLPVYLRRLLARVEPPTSAICFDNEILLQSEVLEVFPEAKAVFLCPLPTPNRGTWAPDSVAPPDRFIAIVDVEMLRMEAAVERFPWLKRAEALLIRARLGAFWSGELDVCTLSISLRDLGFSTVDVIDSPRLSYPQAPAGRAILAYERIAGPPSSVDSRYRVNEAAAYLSTPIVRHRDFCLLAGRGSFGFAAGVHNPGAIFENGRTYLVPRADRTPWALQKANETLFFTSSQPLLLTLEDGQITDTAELSTIDLPDADTSRIGDFRLIKFGANVFTNHFVMSSPRQLASRRALQIDELQTRVGISRLDIEKQQLIWCGFPSLDRPLAKAEKNWAMFTDGKRLFLIYSFVPYVLLIANDWPGLSFTTIIDVSCKLSFGEDGLLIRNSVNPVDYDDAHWLHVVHKVYPSKQYVFWAVLLDKQTLKPVQVTARPLVCGWQSYPAAIIYTCSVIADPMNIMLFSGLDDSATAVAKISRSRLDAEWVAIEN